MANWRCMGDVVCFALLGCGEVELRAGGGNGGAQAAAARRGGGCARGAAQKARGRRKAAARACEDGVLRWRRLAVAAYGGGEKKERG